MKKSILTVFTIIAVLAGALIGWDLVFNSGGILQTGYNAAVTPINKTWQNITGDATATLVPEWEDTGAQSDVEDLGGAED